jgi:hypothetical protein
MKTDSDIFIRDYFNKKLDQTGIEEFENQYRSDPEFKTLADQIEIEIIGIRAYNRQNMKSKFEEWEQESGVSSESLSKSIYWKLAIAASVVLAIGLLFFVFQNPSNEELFLAYYEPYPNYEYTITRNEISNGELLKANAFSAYDQANYAVAAKRFSEILEKDKNNIPVRFFRASSLINLKEYEKCMRDFEIVSASQHEFYSDAATWYLALVFIKSSNTEESKKQLGKILNSQNYAVKANELLSKID